MLVPNNLLKPKKSREKSHSLQFLPPELLEISKEKNFYYKGKKLKSAYLVDIVHNLLLKYYIKKDNRFNLSSVILKDKYGYQYNFYIGYLRDNNIIQLTQDYKRGRNARIYNINPVIFRYEIKDRYKNKDFVLLKKYKKKLYECESKKDLIPPHIKDKLVDDLYSVQIEFKRSISYLESIYEEDIDIYNKNKYSVDAINDQHIFYHFDSFGRLHTNFTILKGFIRKNCLLIDGEETTEIDINNSQPLFLTKLIKDSRTSWVSKDEFELFKSLTISGNYYQYLMDNLKIKDRKKAKELTYKVFFGRNQKNSGPDIKFESLFPTIYNFIKLYKKEHGDYKILAYDLQKSESSLIFQKVINKIMIIYPEIKIITVHDSIIVPKKYGDVVNSIFTSEIINEFSEI